MRRWLFAWGLVCGYAGLIFYLSSLPHPEDSLPSFVRSFSDKVLHVGEYAVLGGLCYLAIRWGTNGVLRAWAVPLAILLASLYGISDEVHQSYVPFRDSSWLDWVADTIGASIGAVIVHRVPSLLPMGLITDRRSQR